MEYDYRASQYGSGGQVLNTLLDDYHIAPFMNQRDGHDGQTSRLCLRWPL